MERHKRSHAAPDTAPRLDLRYMNLTPANLRIWFGQNRTGFVYGLLASVLFAALLILLAQPYKAPTVPAGGHLVRVIPNPTFYVIQAGHQLTLVRNHALTADIVFLSVLVFFFTALAINFIKTEKYYDAKQHRHGHRPIQENTRFRLLGSYVLLGLSLLVGGLFAGMVGYSMLKHIIYSQRITFDPAKNLVSENGKPLGPMSDIQRFYSKYHPGKPSTVEWGIVTKEGGYFAFNNDMDMGPDIYYMGNNNPPLISYLNDYIKSYQPKN